MGVGVGEEGEKRGRVGWGVRGGWEGGWGEVRCMYGRSCGVCMLLISEMNPVMSR